MKKNIIAPLVVVAILIIGRQIRPEVTENNVASPIKNSDTQNKNIAPKDDTIQFSVTTQKSKERRLPEVAFNLTYQEHPQMDVTIADPERKNLDYILFERYDTQDKFLESFNIGYFINDDVETSEEEKLSILQELVNEMSGLATTLDIVSIKTEDFWGRESQVAKFYRTREDETTGEILTYTTLVVLYPNNEAGKNGVLLGFNALQEKSQIISFDDFGTKKSALGQIANTFDFQ